MNLIKQLGDKIIIPDYECYQYHKDNLETYRTTKHLNVFGMTEYRANMVWHALLQYRRENNIFEVGDKVVILTLALGNQYLWTVEDTDGCMIEVSQLGRPNEWAHFAEIAHATDAEIKANKREVG